MNIDHERECGWYTDGADALRSVKTKCNFHNFGMSVIAKKVRQLSAPTWLIVGTCTFRQSTEIVGPELSVRTGDRQVKKKERKEKRKKDKRGKRKGKKKGQTIGPNVECRHRRLRSVPTKCHFHNLCISFRTKNVRQLSTLTSLIVGTLRQSTEKMSAQNCRYRQETNNNGLDCNSWLQQSVPITNIGI